MAVAENLIACLDGYAMPVKYDGYGSCPLTVERGRIVLAEFGYGGKLLPTFPLDPTVPRKSAWFLRPRCCRGSTGTACSRAASGWPGRWATERRGRHGSGIAVSAALGACVGLILGLTGAGGAIMAVPLLVFGLHLQVAQAAPIALLAVGLAAALGAALGAARGKVRYRAAGFIAATGIVVSPLGLWAARRLPNAPLAVIFAGVLGWVAWRMWRGSQPVTARIARPACSTPTPAACAGPRLARGRWAAPA